MSVGTNGTAMDRGASLTLLVTGGVVIGLLVLLYGEASGAGDAFVVGGGAVVLASVAALTVHVARTGPPPGTESESH